ncbi:hypothetical protein MCAV_01590 [[Mycoplasma] cavipharyngis]|uniref:hypothetical protein n=1 Tax=[Mycoplasma] cavipharyngis TaxID=92757 RepID=UPI003703DA8D
MRLKKSPKLIGLVLISLVITGSSYGLYYFLSNNLGAQTSNNYASALEVGYDQNFKIPIFHNKYHDYLQESNKIAILHPANLKAAQSVELNNNEYQTTLSQPEHQFQINQVSSTTNNPHQRFKFYQMNMTKEQIIQAFKHRFEPQLAFLFDLKFSAYDQIQNKNLSFEYKNNLVGFNLTELVLSKSFSHKVFDYSVNNDFINTLGSISGYLITELNRQGDLIISLELETNRLSTRKLSNVSAQNQFQVVINQNNQPQILPIIFWDINKFNDLEQWFWPIPKGPKQLSSVKVPHKDHQTLINENSYTTKFASQSFVYPYHKVNQLDDSSNSVPITKFDNMATIKIKSQVWQKEFFNGWKDQPIPTNPGLKLQFNLSFSVIDVQYHQVQKYQTNVFSFIDLSSLVNGNKVKQEIVDYDLSNGRLQNAGKFKLFVNYRVNISKEIEIQISSEANNFTYVLDQVENVTTNSQEYQSSAKISDIAISRYYYGVNDQITVNANQIKPRDHFAQDLSNGGYSIVQEVNKATSWSDSTGWQRRTVPHHPYLYQYNPIWSKKGILNLSDYVENNADFLNKVFLTFNFSGVPKTNNRTNILLNTPNRPYLISYTEPGFDLNQKKLASKEKITSAKTTNDGYDSFQIPFSKIDQGYNFMWKKVYAFSDRTYKIHEIENSIFNTNIPIETWHWRANDNKNFSAMRVRYWLRLAKVDQFSFSYAVGIDSAAYQWNSRSSLASKGVAGYQINNILIDIKD